MYYNLSQLLKEPVGSTRRYTVDDLASIDDGTIQVLPPGHLTFMRTDSGILVTAGLETRLRTFCSRCLNVCLLHLSLFIEEEYLPSVDIHTGRPIEGPEKDEGGFTTDNQHSLDLSEAIRQYCLTNQPMKPLCRPECLGLCPVCGTNKNEYPCSCEDSPTDPRWGPLMVLTENSTG